jgi:hypothetical protein
VGPNLQIKAANRENEAARRGSLVKVTCPDYGKVRSEPDLNLPLRKWDEAGLQPILQQLY